MSTEFVRQKSVVAFTGIQSSEGFSEAVRGVFDGVALASRYFDYSKPSERLNGEFAKNGEDISITLADTGFEDVGRVIIEDLATYLGSRAWGLLESIDRGEDAAKDSLKHFSGYVVLVLSRVQGRVGPYLYHRCAEVRWSPKVSCTGEHF